MHAKKEKSPASGRFLQLAQPNFVGGGAAGGGGGGARIPVIFPFSTFSIPLCVRWFRTRARTTQPFLSPREHAHPLHLAIKFGIFRSLKLCRTPVASDFRSVCDVILSRLH